MPTIADYYWDTSVRVEHKRDLCTGDVSLTAAHAERDRCCVRVSATCSECGPIIVRSIGADAPMLNQAIG